MIIVTFNPWDGMHFFILEDAVFYGTIAENNTEVKPGKSARNVRRNAAGARNLDLGLVSAQHPP